MSIRTKWLIGANVLLVAVLIGMWAYRALNAPPSISALLREANVRNGIMSGAEFDVLQGKSFDAMIDLADRTVSEMPPAGADDGPWGAKLATVTLRLSINRKPSPEERERMAAVARRLITESHRTNRPVFETEGVTWLGHCGTKADVSLASPYLSSTDPEMRARAEAAIRRLSNAGG